MISSEVESLARTGGLGDVVEALSLALAEIGLLLFTVTVAFNVAARVLVTRSRAPRAPRPVLSGELS